MGSSTLAKAHVFAYAFAPSFGSGDSPGLTSILGFTYGWCYVLPIQIDRGVLQASEKELAKLRKREEKEERAARAALAAHQVRKAPAMDQ